MKEKANRFERQDDLVPQSKLKDLKATVIGLGAIGHQVALQLTAIGVPKLQLIDFDYVEVTNVVTQGYAVNDVGAMKTTATAIDAKRLNPHIEIEEVLDRFRSKYQVGDVVFCCVDSISARRAIWQSVKNRCELFVDGRMSGEVIRVLTSTGNESNKDYETTFFSKAEAFQGTCTSQSTIYSANIAAGLMVQQFSRWLRSIQTDSNLTLNLLASELN